MTAQLHKRGTMVVNDADAIPTVSLEQFPVGCSTYLLLAISGGAGYSSTQHDNTILSAVHSSPVGYLPR